MGIFKAYDIRGTYPDRVNETTALRIGWAFATFLIEETGRRNPVIVLGRDMREHSRSIASSFSLGVSGAGGSVIDIKLCATPMLYFAVGSLAGHELAPAGGCMVTASHNGPEYNGFKLCRAEAVPISGDSGLKRIEELVKSCSLHGTLVQRVRGFPKLPLPEAPAPVPPTCDRSLWDAYWAHIAKFKRRWPEGVSIVADPANGAGCLFLPLLEALGAEVMAMNAVLDGRFPAHEANPIKPRNIAPLEHMVSGSGAALGVAYDGDGDRAVFVTPSGRAVSSDVIAALVARELLKREPGAAIVHDLRSTRALAESVAAAGGRAVRERVGHSFIKATMRREKAAFGGELSGHFYWREAFYAEGALETTAELLNLLGESGATLDDLVKPFERYARSGEVNFHVDDKEAAMNRLAEAHAGADIDRLDGVTARFKDWWFNVRPSNTEPLLRLNAEAESADALAARMAELETLIGGEKE